jgi:large subunit ribosomal protein L20
MQLLLELVSKRILKQAKGFYGKRKNVYTVAKNIVEKGLTYSLRWS